VIGRVILIEGEPFTIVGVSRKWFAGMIPGTRRISRFQSRQDASEPYLEPRVVCIFATGRLRDGVTIQQAGAQLRSFWREVLAATAPTTLPGQRLQSWLVKELEVNSAATGSREMTVRVALGATQLHIVLQLLVESLLLSGLLWLWLARGDDHRRICYSGHLGLASRLAGLRFRRLCGSRTVTTKETWQVQRGAE